MAVLNLSAQPKVSMICAIVMDSGLAIVLAVLAVTAVALLRMWLMRRAARVRIEAQRNAEPIDIVIISNLRVSLVMLAIILPIIFATPFGAMALGEFGRAHALQFVIVLMFVLAAAVIVPQHVRPKWTRVGRATLDRDAFVFEHADQRVEIALAEIWSFHEAFVPPGQGVEVVCKVRQGDAQVVFRYPLLFGEEHFVEGLPLVARSGIRLGPEARALHERLRSLAAHREAVRGPRRHPAR